ncbi:39S ribosomal protein L22, mitochondrial [Toxorhynchites rutilus septentrionalis]|uniref:39S ribosomal protein L22, mitochondrial n=1 Tax=Toxorhynchites rutilus septentrionalis TaxID=329112 RepID=UPI002478903A|nr:39S ribosomal protein L22, mitochondrial [Toxorhynchites rutilus septentrionalis]
MSSLLRGIGRLVICGSQRLPVSSVPINQLHTTSALAKQWNSHNAGTPQRWLKYNKVIYPPQVPGEEPRPAFVCHQKTNIKYSPKKMWYIASFVRGMTVDEALKQLSFIDKKGATAVKETILEAIDMAVKRHNVEFRTNLWVAESFCGKGRVFKGYRRHGRGRAGEVEYKHCHYFVRLEEGSPPENYYPGREPKSGEQMLDEWIESMRKRKVINSL